MESLNIEEVLIAFFTQKGYLCYSDVPNPRPVEFLTVERVGGSRDNVVIDRPSVVIQCWAKSRADAALLAYAIDSLIPELPTITGISSAVRNSLYNFYDDASKNARYQITLDLVTIA